MAGTASLQVQDQAAFGASETQESQENALMLHSASDFTDADLLDQWDTLARNAAEPNPFLEHWYLLPSLAGLDPEGKVQLLCLKHGQQLVGLLPVQPEKSYYGRPLPYLRSWVHPNCFLGTPLVAKGFEQHFWRALFTWSDRQSPALFLHLPELAMDGPIFTALCEAARGDGRKGAIVRHYERAMLRSDLSPQAYFETNVRKKRRKEFERLNRRLEEEGELLIERHTDAAGIADWIDEFLALENAGWKGEAGSALAANPTTAALFRSAATAAAQRGQLDRLTIRLDGTAIAFLSTLLTPQGAFGYKTTYAEDFARFSLGVKLQREFLDILEQDGFLWCDSCAAPDHPMIDHFWGERRPIAAVSLAIGGVARRTLFRALLLAENNQPLEALR